MIHVACATDERYAPYCAAMMHSLYGQHSPRSVTVHLLHAPEFPAAARRRLGELATRMEQHLCLREIDGAAVIGLPEMGHIPRLMWYRVLLPELLPQLDRILYLDADTLIVDRLDDLWETSLQGFELGAVANVIEEGLRHRPRELGMPAGSLYFNSGMLLFNLAAMRASGASARILDYARREAQHLLWPDQDALNVVLGPRCKFLHPRWNCQNTLFYWPAAAEVFGRACVDEATRAPGILHFEGPAWAKPWHYLNDHPYRARYWDHLRATDFPVPQEIGRNFENALRKHLTFPVRSALRRFRQGWRM